MRFFKAAVIFLLTGFAVVTVLNSSQERQPDISGIWKSNIGHIYIIEVSGSRFTWNAETMKQKASGTIDGRRLTASWQVGRRSQSATGKIVEVNEQGRALRIEWSNKVVFFRDGDRELGEYTEQPPSAGEDLNLRAGGLPDISGDWFSNRGHRLSVYQNGPEFRIIYKASGAASLGRFEGDPPNLMLITDFEGGRIEGRVIEVDPNGRAHLIEWSNGMVMGREPFGERGPSHEERSREIEEERPHDAPSEMTGGPDISGTWDSSVKRTYEIVQKGAEFSWTVKGTNEKASGIIEGDHITVEWYGEVGRGRAEGHITGIHETGRVIEIEWSNGVVFMRPAADAVQDQETAPASIKAKNIASVVDIKTVEISKEALKKLIPHLSLKSVFNEWVKAGGPIGGLGYDVRFLSNTPKGKKIILVTDNYSGVNKSIDGGMNWFASNTGINARSGDSQDAIPVFSLTVDPNDPNIVWAGLKDKKGIYKSTDVGATWTDLTANLHISEKQFVFRGFTIMPGDSKTVFAQGEIPTDYDGLAFNKVKGRIYLTRNGGRTWASVREEKDLIRYVIINPQNRNIIYASCGIFDREASNSDCKALAKIQNLEQSWGARGGVGVLKSMDGGKTWQALDRRNGLNDLYVGSLVMHPVDPDILLAGCGNNAASPYRVNNKLHFTGGVFRTDNGGVRWIQTLKDEIITSVEFAPSNPNIAYAGGRHNFYASDDSGKTWQRVSGGKEPWGPPGVIAGFPIDILVDPDDADILFVNNYGGGNVKSTDGGKTWTLASQGYTGALMYDIALHPNNNDIVFAAARSGLFMTENAGASWRGLSSEAVLFPESYSVAVKPGRENIVIASQEMGGIVARSTDGGKTWVKVLQLPVKMGDPLEAYGFKRIVFAPSAPNFVYGGSCRLNNKLDDHPTAYGVYKSAKEGAPNSWIEANDASMKNQAVNDLAVHPKNHNVVYAATVKGGLFKTIDGGKSWSVIRIFADRDVRSVAIDPIDPMTVYAGLQKGGVYRSTDDGKNWHRMAAGINENQMVWALVVDPVDRSAWAGTRRSGVYKWDSIEQQWIPVNKGLSTRAVVDLEISADGRVLYASTTGEGVFRYEKK